MTRVESERQSEPQEDLLKWAIRYVMIPVTVAALAGVFALAVVDRQFELQNRPPDEDTINMIFATMTAAADSARSQSDVEPSGTATAVPTQTEEVPQDGTETSQTVPNPPTPVSPVCPQVPYGWQLYTVQPGNTLFSLAQQTGTTVATIRQVNCLYGELLAYSQIWLPDVFIGRPDPIVEVTRIVEPIDPITPTVTVTEPTPLPDIAIGAIEGQALACYPDCEPAVPYTVSNIGSAPAGAFTILLTFSSGNLDGFNELPQPITGLEPGASQTLYLPNEPLLNCYFYGCEIRVAGDSLNQISEESEGNNETQYTFPGHGGLMQEQESDQ